MTTILLWIGAGLLISLLGSMAIGAMIHWAGRNDR